ncbi:MAG TPA: hypothetical protein PKZ74_10800 [Bacteroidales bacterium]|nr:hypothetical protein [Bacteroidales bacterium]
MQPNAPSAAPWAGHMIVDYRLSTFDFRIFPSAIDNGQWTMDNGQSSGPAWAMRVCYAPMPLYHNDFLNNDFIIQLDLNQIISTFNDFNIWK